MVRIHWRLTRCPQRLKQKLVSQWRHMKLVAVSLFYNEFTSTNVVLETMLEPMFWFVDHFARYLGPIFTGICIILTLSVVMLFYLCIIPYVFHYGLVLTAVHLVFGHWVLLNIMFHYIMGLLTEPGTPPPHGIPSTVSVCRRCISPKPPRTHHCSVCDKCVLRMDHHCPWINNCVGFYNHRYFFLFCCYMDLGCLYVSYSTYGLFCQFFYGDMEYVFPAALYPLNIAYGFIMGVKKSNASISTEFLNTDTSDPNMWYDNAVMYLYILCSAVFVALLALTTWHFILISKGETSIEAYINEKERKRLKKTGVIFRNPYDFGFRTNWKMFLGITESEGRKFWRHVLWPSNHAPSGNGLIYRTFRPNTHTHDPFRPSPHTHDPAEIL